MTITTVASQGETKFHAPGEEWTGMARIKILLQGGSFVTLRQLDKSTADEIQKELTELTNNPDPRRMGMFVKKSPIDEIAVPLNAIIGYARHEFDD